MIVDVSVKSFKVHLEDYGVPIIRSKVVHGPVLHSKSQMSSNKSFPSSMEELQPRSVSSSGYSHRFSGEEKDKDPIISSRPSGSLGNSIDSLPERDHKLRQPTQG